MNKAVIIPAVKKNVAFYDDLIKKMAGQSLIERVINKAKEIANDEDIYVLTDSEEIRLISRRKGVLYFFKKSLKLSPGSIVENLIDFLVTVADDYQTRNQHRKNNRIGVMWSDSLRAIDYEPRDWLEVISENR